VEFFKTLLQTQVKQMQWGDDMPWGLGGTNSEIDEDDLETFIEKRKVGLKMDRPKQKQCSERCSSYPAVEK
jgi:hypothetical protein